MDATTDSKLADIFIAQNKSLQLCYLIEALPASIKQTEISIVASEVRASLAATTQRVEQLEKALRLIKLTSLTCKSGRAGLAHIIRLCINAGIKEHLDELREFVDNQPKAP